MKHLVLTITLILLILLVPAAAALDIAKSPQTIYTTGEDCTVRAVTDGTRVLISDSYLNFRDGGPHEEFLKEGMLHLYTIADKTLTTIPGTANILPWDIRLSGDNVYWQVLRFTEDPLVTEYDVYHYQIQSGDTTKLDIPKLPRAGTEYLLSYKPVPGPDPYAVTITARHIRTGEEQIVPLPENADAWTIKMSGDRMVFGDMPEKGGKAMYLYNFVTKKTTLIDEVSNGTVKVMGVFGDTLMYLEESSGKKLYAKNLTTQETKLLTDVPMNYDETDLSGDLAVWRGWYWNDDFSLPDRVTTPLYAASVTDSGGAILLDRGVRQPSAKDLVVVWSKWDDEVNRDTIKIATLQ